MPEPIHDDVFGRLTWDETLNCWLGGIDWPPGLHTEVAIWPPEGDTAAGLRTARTGLDWLRSHGEYVRQCIAREMLELYNDAWRDEEEPISEEEFFSRIELNRVAFGDDGSLLLSYYGGAMFGGHLIDADFGPDKSFRGTMLIG